MDAAVEARVAAFRALLADRGLPADDVPEENLVELLGALDAANMYWSGQRILDRRVAHGIATVAEGLGGSFVGFAEGDPRFRWPPHYRAEKDERGIRVVIYELDDPAGRYTRVVALPGL